MWIRYFCFTRQKESPLVRATLGRLRLARGDGQRLPEGKVQRGVVRRHADHVVALLGKLPRLLAARGVYAALLARLVAGGQGLCQGIGELRLDDAVEDRVPDVVA